MFVLGSRASMIPRYTPDDFAELWSPQRKYATWLEVELAACEAMENAGIVPKGTAAEVRPFSDRLSADRIDETAQHLARFDLLGFSSMTGYAKLTAAIIRRVKEIDTKRSSAPIRFWL